MKLGKQSVSHQISNLLIDLLRSYELMPSYYIKWVIICYFDYLFWCSNYPQFYQWQPLQAGYYVVLKCPPHTLSTYLYCGTKKMFQVHLVFLCNPHWKIFLTLLWLRHRPDQKPSLTAWTLTTPTGCLPTWIVSSSLLPWTRSMSLFPTPLPPPSCLT